ncbi:MAG: hypothetical protein IJ688_01520 [Treponema sp.]|nr:hypothetical protein [Treponema sp.]
MKKLILSILTSLILAATAFALPGFESYLPDYSGEYVYYKDNSFTRESYVGILYYNESTLQIRYYAPQDNVNYLPEKNISILLTINPDAPYWEMTGERMVSTIMPGTEDVDLVNYLHDLLYEFSAHRIKTEIVENRETRIIQDYEQFGGSVTIIYDCTIPMFNIRDIIDTEGKTQLKCITTGRLKDNSDTSFDDFKGFPQENTETTGSKKSKSKKSKAKSVKYSFENQTLTLDSDWTQAMDNLWLLRNDSVATLSTLPAFDNDDETRNQLFILRRVIQSARNAYTNYSSLSISNKDTIKITSKVFHSDREQNVYSTMILSKKKGSSDFDIFSISTYEEPWLENTSYFQKIIKSYSN